MATNRRLDPVTLLTVICSIGWTASFVSRIVSPEMAGSTAATDVLMTTVVSYWFTTRKARNDKNDKDE
jgi:hypothetical protein